LVRFGGGRLDMRANFDTLGISVDLYKNLDTHHDQEGELA